MWNLPEEFRPDILGVMFDLTFDGFVDLYEIREGALNDNNDDIIIKAGRIKNLCGFRGVRVIPFGTKMPSTILAQGDYVNRPDKLVWYGPQTSIRLLSQAANNGNRIVMTSQQLSAPLKWHGGKSYRK